MSISTKNILINKFLKKLNYKIIDSYFIIKVVNSFYQIKLFEFAKIFDTFYSNFLKKASENSLSKQINEFASSMIINNKKK